MKTKFVVPMFLLAAFAFPSIGHAELPKAETVKCDDHKTAMKKQAAATTTEELTKYIELEIKAAYQKLHPPGTVKSMRHTYEYKLMPDDVISITITTKVDAGADSMVAQTSTELRPGLSDRYSYRDDTAYSISQSDNSVTDAIGRYTRPSKVKCSTYAHYKSYEIKNQESGKTFASSSYGSYVKPVLEIPVQ